jgi:tetratricopeptide (TPR) repeat protein
MSVLRRRILGGLVIAATGLAACGVPLPPAMPSAPRYPDVPALVVPATVTASTEVLARHDSAWRRLQSGDLRGATRDYQAALTADPAFYPAEAGLGYVAFIDERWEESARAFDAALARNPAYRPALTGRVETALSANDPVGAIRALELWLTTEPEGSARDDVRSRLDVLRLRAVQAELSTAMTARQANRLDEAQAALDRARMMAPESAVVLREVARVEGARGAFDEAEQHAREAIALDPGDPEAHAVLGEVLEAHGRLREAAAAFERAMAIDPRAEWRERVATINSRADFNALPAEYRSIPSAQALTRGQLAALLGSRLQTSLERAPRRVTVVLTDVRSHWAAAWILPVTRAGIMDPLPNHTFQPNAIVRRSDLALVMWQAIQVLGGHRASDIARWRDARPTLVDVPRAHLAANAIAAVVASGAMSAGDDGRFAPGRAVTGAEAIAAVARLEQIAGGGQ